MTLCMQCNWLVAEMTGNEADCGDCWDVMCWAVTQAEVCVGMPWGVAGLVGHSTHDDENGWVWWGMCLVHDDAMPCVKCVCVKWEVTGLRG